MTARKLNTLPGLTRRTAIKAGGVGIASMLISRQAPAVIAQDHVEISFAGIKIFGDDPMPALLALTGEWTDGVARRGEAWLVFVPTLAVPHPATTIGLGDSFTAGVLAML